MVPGTSQPSLTRRTLGAIGSGLAATGRGAMKVVAAPVTLTGAALRGAGLISRGAVDIVTGEPLGEGPVGRGLGGMFDLVTKVMPDSVKADFASKKCDVTKDKAMWAMLPIVVVGVGLGWNSWGNFVGNLIFEIVMLFVAGWLSRTCHSSMAWIAAMVALVVPIIVLAIVKNKKKSS